MLLSFLTKFKEATLQLVADTRATLLPIHHCVLLLFIKAMGSDP
jgi:hypothetical protein